MSFYSKNFDVYVVLTAPQGVVPWSKDRWREIAEELEPFVSSPRGKTALRTTQIDVNNAGKTLSFGRLGWDAKSHGRWTQVIAVDDDTSGKRPLFLSAESWSPSWAQCEREKEAPDFFVSLHNAHSDITPRVLLFRAILVVALSSSEASAQRALLRSAIEAIAIRAESPLSVCKERTWGRPVGTVGYTDALNDLGLIGLFKPGDPHRRPIDLSTFAEQWAALTP